MLAGAVALLAALAATTALIPGLVSLAAALRDRDDLLFPDDLVRDGDGNVVGCSALSSFHPNPLGGA